MTQRKGGPPEKGGRYIGDNRGCFQCSNPAKGSFAYGGGSQVCAYHEKKKQRDDIVCYAIILSPCWLWLIATIVYAVIVGL